MSKKKTIIIAWKFYEDDIIVELTDYKIILVRTPEGSSLISQEKFNDLMSEIDNIESNLFAFIHDKNFNGNDDNGENMLECLKERINRSQNILVLEISGGTSIIYDEFIDQNERKLNNITDDDIEVKLNKCVQKYDTLPKLIQLHKHLVLNKMQGTDIDDDMLDELADENKNLEIAIEAIPANIGENDINLLKYISNEVIKYGA